MVIDLSAVRWALGEHTVVIGHSGVARLRYGQFSPDTSRIVLDLDRPLAVRLTQLLPADREGTAPHRLVLDLAPVSQAAFEAAAAPPAPAKPAAQARLTPPAGPVPLPQRKPVARQLRPPDRESTPATEAATPAP